MEEKIDETLAGICLRAALGTRGVARLSGGLTESLSRNIWGKASPTSGVKVSAADNEVSADVYIIVQYGVKIPDVAWNLQENIKRELEKTAGRRVKAVNIHVQGVAF